MLKKAIQNTVRTKKAWQLNLLGKEIILVVEKQLYFYPIVDAKVDVNS